jgi:hypothetical protein
MIKAISHQDYIRFSIATFNSPSWVCHAFGTVGDADTSITCHSTFASAFPALLLLGYSLHTFFCCLLALLATEISSHSGDWISNVSQHCQLEADAIAIRPRQARKKLCP